MDAALQKLADRFTHFADHECQGKSALYEALSRGIAADADLLRLATYVREGQPAPNMIFAAAHYLLLQETTHPLAVFYPTLTPDARPPDEAFPGFRDFCLTHQEAMRELVATHMTQTNEVRRCVGLMPAFVAIEREALALIEIGPSAGLNLLWDRYRYRYGRRETGPVDAPLLLDTVVRGELTPPIPDAFPAVMSRVGVDLNPIDVHDADDARWLRALIWPEHVERVRRLEQALEIARREPPQLIAGDALEHLPALMRAANPDATLVVFHSYTINQFSNAMQNQLDRQLKTMSRERDVFRVWLEWERRFREGALYLLRYRRGRVRKRLLAVCEPHGRWVEWRA